MNCIWRRSFAVKMKMAAITSFGKCARTPEFTIDCILDQGISSKVMIASQGIDFRTTNGLK